MQLVCHSPQKKVVPSHCVFSRLVVRASDYSSRVKDVESPLG